MLSTPLALVSTAELGGALGGPGSASWTCVGISIPPAADVTPTSPVTSRVRSFWTWTATSPPPAVREEEARASPLAFRGAGRPRPRCCGTSARRPVVAYDDQSGAIAARLWYLLRAHGHEAVAVLDGGFAKWTAEGRAARDGGAEARDRRLRGPPRSRLRRRQGGRDRPRSGLPRPRRPCRGALSRRGGAHRPPRRPHSRGEERALHASTSPPTRFPSSCRPPSCARATRRSVRPPASRSRWSTAAPASPPATTCWPCTSRASAAGSTRAPGASGAPIPRRPVATGSE